MKARVTPKAAPKKKPVKRAAKTKAKATKPRKSTLTDTLLAYMHNYYLAGCGPDLGEMADPEHKFAKPRRWRFDLSWPTLKVAVELDGGVFNRGRHVQPVGFTNDLYKINRAIELGWVVLRYTPQMLKKDPFGVIDQIRSVMVSRVSTH